MNRERAGNVDLRPRVGLGTVQFGLEYGIANEGARPTFGEVQRILDCAEGHGVSLLDTAALYGDAEAVLGRALPAGHRFDVVTKTPVFGGALIEARHADMLERAVHTSLKRLRLDDLYGLLIHSADDLLVEGGEWLMERAQTLRARGEVRKVGVSVYEPAQAERILEHHTIDLIQIPLNVLDQRFSSSGILDKLQKAGVEIHSRSVFLQGALLMSPDKLPPHFEGARDKLRRYREVLTGLDITPAEAAVDFVKRQPQVDGLIVGVCSVQQLGEVMAAYHARCPPCVHFADFAEREGRVIDPRLWPPRQ